MVLVGTSVWIRAPFAAELDRLLDRDEVAGHDLIFGELLIGDPGGREEFLNCHEVMHRVAPVPHEEVVAFARAYTLHARGIDRVDAHLLASALVAGVPLWTAEERLRDLADELGAGYSPTTA